VRRLEIVVVIATAGRHGNSVVDRKGHWIWVLNSAIDRVATELAYAAVPVIYAFSLDPPPARALGITRPASTAIGAVASQRRVWLERFAAPGAVDGCREQAAPALSRFAKLGRLARAAMRAAQLVSRHRLECRTALRAKPEQF